MTWGMTAIGFIDIGDFATAAAYFNQSYSNIQPPFNVWCVNVFSEMRALACIRVLCK